MHNPLTAANLSDSTPAFVKTKNIVDLNCAQNMFAASSGTVEYMFAASSGTVEYMFAASSSTVEDMFAASSGTVVFSWPDMSLAYKMSEPQKKKPYVQTTLTGMIVQPPALHQKPQDSLYCRFVAAFNIKFGQEETREALHSRAWTT